MRFKTLISAAVAAVCPVASYGQSSDDFPDMLGTYECNIEYGAMFFGLLQGPYAYELGITSQLGAAFEGYFIWVGDRKTLPDEQIDRPGQTIVSEEGSKVTIREELLGMIGWGEYNLHMVDAADEARKTGRLIKPGEFEFIDARPGERATLTRTRCIRQQQ
ncbi:hypothetical protein [Ruegeria halocynthiae]|uniref:hypothetical protein n=1 Tax=Ruegeria halocynthiae TaxID=985054 RepID=UPI000560AD8C|nr:hypothetical protein [Ruegeria halocynthiae]